MRKGIAILAFTLLSASGEAADRHWQMGILTSIDVKRQVVDFGPGSSGFGPPKATQTMRAMADVRVYVIETDSLRIELRDVGPVGRASLDASVGESVTLAIEKSNAYVRDADGVEHKLRVVKKTDRKAAPK